MPKEMDKPSAAYAEMAKGWQLPHDLMGGTRAMHAAGDRWLPMEVKEQWEDWKRRLNRSVLYNGFRDTVGYLASRPFQKPVTIKAGEKGLWRPLNFIEKNCDRAGTTLSDFGKQLLTCGLTHGLVHTFVDFPKTDGKQTFADEQERVRPYFLLIPAPRLLGGRVKIREDNGAVELEQIRILEIHTEADGKYDEKQVRYVRVIEKGGWQLFKQMEESDDWEMAKEGELSLDEIPLRTLYFNRTGHLMAAPPLEDLAWINLAHWQSQSDQRNILRFARLPILYETGIESTEATKKLELGPGAKVRRQNPLAKLVYVEHSGAAIAAGRQDLVDLKEEMSMLGAQPFIQRTGSQTATGQGLDEERCHSDMQAWVRSAEFHLEECFELAGKWMNRPIPEDFSVDLFSEFALSMRAAEDVRALIDMRKAKEISRRTFLEEIRRRGVVSETLVVEDEIEAIEQEGPDLSEILPPGAPGAPGQGPPGALKKPGAKPGAPPVPVAGAA